MGFVSTVQGIGQSISNLGTQYKLPELGISEMFGYHPSPSIGPQGTNPALQPGMTVQQANQVLGANTQNPVKPQGTVGQNITSGQTNTGTGTVNQGGGVAGIDPSMIDSAYADTENQLNQWISGYQDQMQEGSSYLQNIQKPFEAQLPEVGNQAQAQTQTAQSQGENAITAATRLAGELSKGGLQRLGGSNSAAKFYQGQVGNELQRNVGGVRQTVMQNLQAVNTWKDTEINKIKSGMTAAVSEAKSRLQSAIEGINSNKALLSQQKAQAKIQTMQDYNNTLNSISTWRAQTETQIKQTAYQNLTNMAQAIAPYGGNTQPAYQSNLSLTQNPGQAVSSPVVSGYRKFNDQGQVM
jgi:hypothetical protein